MESKPDKTNHYRPLKEPVTIIDQEWPVGTLPLVYIRTLTYMHENFIRECIEGILMQKTTFPVRVLIHDDASTDKTPEIVREYEMKYPNLIKAYFQTTNSYSQENIENRRRLMTPFNEMCIGKYCALCEGDDYWTDPLKLQKQVTFLENNPEYGLVHGDCHKFYDEDGLWVYNVNKHKINKKVITTKEELFYAIINMDYTVFTATVIYRHELLGLMDKNSKVFPMGDSPKWLVFSQHTRFKYMDEVFAVYRILNNSLSRSSDLKQHFRFILAMMEMRIYYCEVIGYDIKTKLKKNYNSALLRYLLLDPAFMPEHEMMDPTIWQRYKYKLIRIPILNWFLASIFVVKFRLKKFIKKKLSAIGILSLHEFLGISNFK